MPDKHARNRFGSATNVFKILLTLLVLPTCWMLLFLGSAWSQQSKRENIYLDGKLVSVEKSSMTPLVVNITSPTSNPTYSTNSSPITLSGTLANNVGSTQVTWANDRGGSGNCSGTTSWTCSGIAMQIGQNVLTVSARDSVLNLGVDVLTVSYCSSTLSPTGASIAAGGGTGNVSVTCASGCTWTATSNNPWITVTGGSSGSGNGTVSYSVAANSNPYPFRTGTITIAGQTFTVVQYPCPYCGDGFCFMETCMTCPQDCCPNCNMSCLYMCLYMGGDYGTCAAQCGCN